MAATTITRESMTDGVTAWTVARIGSAIYDKIDALIGANITFGGLVNAEGFGAHAFSTGGTGSNRLQVRNTTAGVGNFAALDAGNNSTALLTRVLAMSSTYTPSGYLLASGSVLEANGAGGLSIATTDAAGDIRLYTGGSSTLRLTITDAGLVSLGTSTGMDCGFLAYNSSADTGLTGAVTVDFDSESYDHGTHFASDTFTAPTTGLYSFSAAVTIYNNSGGTRRFGAYFYNGASAATSYFGLNDVTDTTYRTFTGAIVLSLTAGDTISVQLSTPTVAAYSYNVEAGTETWFCGRRVF